MSVQTFASQPKAVVAKRTKYRAPQETDTTVYRDPKETSIMWDRRVHRGSTYSMYTQRAIKEALEDATASPQQIQLRRPRRTKETSPFLMGLPEPERVPVDLTQNLVATEVVVETGTVEAQTDEFLPEPPPEQYLPQKTGVDVSTQVEDGELFNFDYEVEPILDVIVNKTLEQSIMEVEEEYEMERMKEFKVEWYERQEVMMKDWQDQVGEEWDRWHAKNDVMRQKREQKRREAQVLLKVQAIAAAKAHLTGVVKNAVTDLKPVAFPDERATAVNRSFLPQLLGQVRQLVQGRLQTERVVDEMVANAVGRGQREERRAVEAMASRRRDIGKIRFEEAQIRNGIVRLFVADGAGGQKNVGPLNLSTAADLPAASESAIAWLSEHEPRSADAYAHGGVLVLDGSPAGALDDVFAAGVGQLSLERNPTPPPSEPKEAEEDRDLADDF